MNIDMGEITMYGADWCGDCRRAKRLLERLNLPYRYIDVEHDPAMAERAQRIGGSKRIPVVILPDERVLVEPSDPELQDALVASGAAAAPQRR
jgi:mycoredoxin